MPRPRKYDTKRAKNAAKTSNLNANYTKFTIYISNLDKDVIEALKSRKGHIAKYLTELIRKDIS